MRSLGSFRVLQFIFVYARYQSLTTRNFTLVKIWFVEFSILNLAMTGHSATLLAHYKVWFRICIWLTRKGTWLQLVRIFDQYYN